MIEFAQVYGSWILIGLLFLVMMRMHGSHGGMGCDMGDAHGHQPDQEPGTVRVIRDGQEVDIPVEEVLVSNPPRFKE